MTDTASSYRSIVRSTGIVAGSQLGVLLIGLFRAKLFALWVGPTGIGLLGILNSLLANVALVTSMGLGTSAVRHVADPSERPATVRRAVLWLALLLGTIGGLATFMLRAPMSTALTGDAGLADEIGWLGLAVGLTVFAAALTAVVQGLRRLGDLAILQLGGTTIGVVVGTVAVAMMGVDGIIVAAIAAPAGLVIVGLVVHSRIRLATDADRQVSGIRSLWAAMLKVGAVIMVTALIAGLTQTLLRTLILRNLGIEQLGLFQAASAISTMNVTLVLTAMAADYYPRLSQVADDGAAIERLLNQQLHVAILASLPILVMLSAGSGLWLQILYSGTFTPAADLLRWQALGEAVRLPLWALGYVLLARRDTAAFVIHELSFSLTSVPALLLAMRWLGLEGAGLAFLIGYLASFAVTLALVRWRHGVALSGRSLRLWLLLTAATGALLLLGRAAPVAAMAIGIPLAVGLGLHALRTLAKDGALPGPLARLMQIEVAGP